ncbi:hypothetical protein OG589_44050 [Sphaerisporangium sp. NBC_01403]|uniref:hypothetical protein n=1 Tax=Sphaerisporangium sp. NBC_01403 TaxID=2903599 RepID=UPI00325680E9
MADGAGISPSRPGSGRPPTYVPSYEAPTTPMPRVSPEQALAMAEAAKARAAKTGARQDSGDAATDHAGTDHAGTDSAAQEESTRETVDYNVTADVRRPAGPFLRPDRPVAGSAATQATQATQATAAARATPARPAAPEPGPPSSFGALADRPRPAAPRARRRPRWLALAIFRIGDIPIRAVYGIGAAIVTGIVVVLIFMLFGGDTPGEQVRVSPAQGSGPAASGAPPSPKPTPIAVPPVPAAKTMTVFTGTGTPVASYAVDQTAGISYAQYGTPWAKTTRDPFTSAQKAGTSRQSQALIGSAPVPVAVPRAPATYEDFRKLAGKAAKWTLRYQPAGSKFTWTVSQRARYNLGWVLGYKVSYVQGGKKHSSQAYVMVISTAKKKPAMLFASVPDTRAALYHDLNMLFWTARAI